ncbi:MAG TPA: hypothetical protein VHR65_04800 [Solirubrobacterales bacterium]|nr:hypothetical protein [Solirubrobacterales bacterium]
MLEPLYPGAAIPTPAGTSDAGARGRGAGAAEGQVRCGTLAIASW